MTCPTPVQDGPTITIERAAELLHCSRSRVFELLADGRIQRAPKFGKRTTIVTASVLECLEPELKPPQVLKKRRYRSRAQLDEELRAACERARAAGSSG
jgi:excisionase family DNA binding protein